MHKYLIASVIALGITQWSANPISLPTGALLLKLSGTCPLGTTENVNLNGRTILGTTVANGNAGTTGGVDNITPVGTNSSLIFTGNSVASSVITAGTPAGTNSSLIFTGIPSTEIVNHLHTLATGTTATGNFSQVIGAVDTSSGGVGATPTQTALGTRSGNPVAGGVASYTPTGTINTPAFTGNILGTHGHTTTATGSINTPAFTGTQFDNRSAFIRVIVCLVD